MHSTIIFQILQVWLVIGMFSASMVGENRIEQAGWVAQAAQGGNYVTRQPEGKGHARIRSYIAYRHRLAHSWKTSLIRSLLLWGMWQISGQVGPEWIVLLPWLIWILPGQGARWGKLRRMMWEIQRIVMVGYLALAVIALARQIATKVEYPFMLGMGCLVCGEEEPKVTVEEREDGSYQATLCGHFTLSVSGNAFFRKRLLIVFLGLLQSNHDERHSRRTRDGRTPFLRQEQLGAWFGVPQEQVSLYTRYWLEGDWANLLSLKTAEVLTVDLIERIVTVFATFPKWNAQQVYRYLRGQGLKVSQRQVDQAAEQSGWKRLQASFSERYEWNERTFHVKDKWLIAQLLTQVQDLLAKIEAGLGLTPEEQHHLNDLQALAATVDDLPQPPLPARPWIKQMEQILFADWEVSTQEQIRCPDCGSTDIAPKSKKPRWKKYYDAAGNLQQVAVYRYYCRNSQCPRKTFTHLPAGLAPYSPYRTQFRLLALQMYAWGYSTYRRTGTAMGLHSMTVWRWVSDWGHDLLPVAALFGVVKSSGVVGVDEKFVLVPKNDKPESKACGERSRTMRRWMYVYLAVDVWTYDLLHIAIYPYNEQDSAHAFLLALRAKGYHPSVIVTDLRQDYDPIISLVFPQAEHHECIFHALQNVQKYVKDVYGPNYAQEHPEAVLLKQKIYDIFDAPSASEAQLRFSDVLNLKNAYIQACPDAISIFDFLERHWPYLVNGIDSPTIPSTNNTTELVIRRFDQHYQNFCGFESIDSAHTYLAVFEKLYRFTPFSQDAQPRIRGKSPLQLAGYDVSNLPFSAICFGLSIDWPTELSLVPNL